MRCEPIKSSNVVAQDLPEGIRTVGRTSSNQRGGPYTGRLPGDYPIAKLKTGLFHELGIDLIAGKDPLI
jgi:hypothetical protein